jgi:hypothetical protein
LGFVVNDLKKNAAKVKFYIITLGYDCVAKNHCEIEEKRANHYTFILHKSTMQSSFKR